MKKIFLLLIAGAAACMVCTGCVMTRFSEALLECGKTYQTPEIVTEVAPEDQMLWKKADGSSYLYLPVVAYEQSPAPLYVFYVPEFVPFLFTKQHTGEVRTRRLLKLSDRAAQDLINGKKDVALFDELQLKNEDASLSPKKLKMKKIPVSFNRKDLENEDQLPVWSSRSVGGWLAQVFLPVTFCADIVSSVACTLFVDCIVLPGMGIVWLVEESLTTCPGG